MVIRTQPGSAGMLNLDTHILIDLMAGHLSPKEEKVLRKHSWCISDIVLWELHKLNQLKRIELDFKDKELRKFLSSLDVLPIDLTVLAALDELDFRSDPADELIAATSLAHKIPLATRDQRLLKSKIVPMAFKN